MKREILRLEQVCLQEHGTHYLKDFSLHLNDAEITGLLPVDSHGLSALIELLKTNSAIQKGRVYYRGKLVNSADCAALNGNRIAVIQRESSLVDDLTVAENIFVLRSSFRAHIIKRRILERELQPFLEEIGVQIEANAYVDKLPLFERCVVEIVKAVVNGCRLIVLRELNTIISETQLEQLHGVIQHYTTRGFSFLYISFHMEELAQICNHVALMEHGRMIKMLRSDKMQLPCADTYTQLVRQRVQEREFANPSGVAVFSVQNLACGTAQGLSFEVSAGECLVLQDVKNCVFQNFLDVLLGEVPMMQGAMTLCEKSFAPKICREIAIIPERPFKTMIFPDMSYFDNLCFTLDHRIPSLWINNFLQQGLKLDCNERFSENLFDESVKHLTHAQQYDLVFRRILLQNPKIVFCLQPFRGADMELRMHIFDLLKGLLDKGIAVVILAVNLADSLSLADRLIRIHGDIPDEVYLRKDFAKLPFTAPFMSLYTEN